MEFEIGAVTGHVTEVGISGAGVNSGQLQFTIQDGDVKATYVMNMDYRGEGSPELSTEPQVFATAAAILVAAFQSKTRVHVAWRRAVGITMTPIATQVRVPG